MKISTTIKHTITMALILCSLNHFASASYISEGDEIGEIAARYRHSKKVQDMPSLKVDFDLVTEPNEDMFEQFMYAYIDQNNIHPQMIEDPEQKLQKSIREIFNDVFNIQGASHHLHKAYQGFGLNENHDLFSQFKEAEDNLSMLFLKLIRIMDKRRV